MLKTSSFFSSQRKKIFSFLLLLLLFPFLLYAAKKAVFLFLEATEKPANITIDASSDLGSITPLWQALAQGGEDPKPLDGVERETAALKPRYIRIDHLYDFYHVVEKKNGQLVFNWQELDAVVNQILKTGAKPFLSLSYMPPAIAKNGDITGPPVNWSDWQAVVRETVQHFSGRQQRNLTNVIYEVWNEPDLFGNWKIGGGERDYRLLYRFAVRGAEEAKNVNPFQIGGPSTTSPYRNWVDQFLDYVFRHRLRCDFYSWHRYSLSTKTFLDDINLIDSWLFKHGGQTLPKYLTEWGPDSENSPVYDHLVGAAHLVATSRQLLQRVDLAFVFEIKDGLQAEKKKYWGRWGLLTNPGAGPVEKKPRYLALQLLNRMTGQRLRLEGENRWINGFASRDGKTIRLLLVNFDPRGRHFENVPLTFNNLPSGTYQYQETFLRRAGRKMLQNVAGWTLLQKIPLAANDIVLIELTKL